MHKDTRIERYILGQMDEGEAEAFEADFIANQACLDQLELAQRLHQGMQDLKHDALFEQANTPMAAKAWWQQSIPAWSLAAAVLLTVVLPVSLQHSPAPLSSPVVDVISVELAGLRGEEFRGEEGHEFQLSLGNSQNLLSFYIDTDIPQFNANSFDFVLRNAEQQVVFETSGLTLNNASTLFINLGTRKFEAGDYQMQIFGHKSGSRQLLQSGKAIIN